MYIYDQRKPFTCNFSQLNQGDLFAYEEGDDLFYLMVLDEGDCDYYPAVVLGARESDTHLTGTIWKFNGDEEVQPLKGDLKVWAK
jgi:hypothetical protein